MKELQGKYTGAKVYSDHVEEYALAQIQMLIDNPAFSGSTVRVMPDVHPGAIGPIGFTAMVVDRILLIRHVYHAATPQPQHLLFRRFLSAAPNDRRDGYMGTIPTGSVPVKQDNRDRVHRDYAHRLRSGDLRQPGPVQGDPEPA